MTIYALSTGPGVSGIAVIRISGKETKVAINKITGKSLPKPRMAVLRKFNKINILSRSSEAYENTYRRAWYR